MTAPMRSRPIATRAVTLAACVGLLVLDGGRAWAGKCQPDGSLRVVVELKPPSGKTIAGVVVDLDYPEPAVQIPGSADAPEVKARISGTPPGFLETPNDQDDDVIVAIAGTSALPAGPIFTVEFDRCKGEPQPGADAFRCKVKEASTDKGVLVDGTTCRATISNTKATKTAKKKEGSV